MNELVKVAMKEYSDGRNEWIQWRSQWKQTFLFVKKVYSWKAKTKKLTNFPILIRVDERHSNNYNQNTQFYGSNLMRIIPNCECPRLNKKITFNVEEFSIHVLRVENLR